MQRVRARFGGGLHQSAGDGTKLGVIVAGGDLELLQRIDVGIDYGNPKNGAIVLRTVEQEAIRRELLAVNVDLQATLRVL